MLKLLFWIVVLAALLFLAWQTVGCSEAQRQAVDKVVADANAAGGAARDLADNPLIPEPLALGLEAIGLALGGAALAWAKMRPKIKLLTETAGCIVQAVEESTGQTQTELKNLVMEKMDRRGIYDRANKLVDSLKTK